MFGDSFLMYVIQIVWAHLPHCCQFSTTLWETARKREQKLSRKRERENRKREYVCGKKEGWTSQ